MTQKSKRVLTAVPGKVVVRNQTEINTFKDEAPIVSICKSEKRNQHVNQVILGHQLTGAKNQAVLLQSLFVQLFKIIDI